MGSMLAPYTLNITGGTFTQVHSDVHYVGNRSEVTLGKDNDRGWN